MEYVSPASCTFVFFGESSWQPCQVSCLKQGPTLVLPFGSKEVAALIHGRYPVSEARRTLDMTVILRSQTGGLNANA